MNQKKILKCSYMIIKGQTAKTWFWHFILIQTSLDRWFSKLKLQKFVSMTQDKVQETLKKIVKVSKS